MRKALIIAFSITICFIAFVISKIVISVLLYKRWRRKQMIHEEGYPGMRKKGMFAFAEKKKKKKEEKLI